MAERFAEMSWTLVPPEPRQTTPTRRKPTLRITMNAKGMAYLSIPKAAIDQLRIDRHIELLVNGRAIAVRAADKDDRNARSIAKSNRTSGITAFATKVLHLRPGESVRMDATIEDGHCWAYLPDELVRRMREGRVA